jgi:hypothetical protein
MMSLPAVSRRFAWLAAASVLAVAFASDSWSHEFPFGVPAIVLQESQADDCDEPFDRIESVMVAQAGGGRKKGNQAQVGGQKKVERDPDGRALIDVYNVKVPGVENVTLRGTVVDADTGEPIACRVHVENSDGIYYAPEGHWAIAVPPKNDSGIEYEPDVTNNGKIWAVLEGGVFTVSLPAVDGYKIEPVRGLEYDFPSFTLDLEGQTGEIERTFALKRGINMRERNWMSADSHIHNLMPSAAIIQMKAEALDYTNLMFIGPGHRLLKDGFVTGEPTIVEDGYIVYASQELRDSFQGHQTLLGIRDPIKPIQGRVGKEAHNLEYIPHDPMNWEVYDRMHEQGGLAFHAHYLYWPGYSSAACAALNKLDGIEWLTPDMVMRGNKTRQNIEVPGYELTGAGPMWYYMLSNGCRLPVIGGTDKMNAKRVVGGGNRTYARVDEWSHQGFLDALDRGETFTSNGPLLNLTANGQGIGSDLKFSGDGPFTVTVDAGCHTEKPITYFQIVQDGKVARELPVEEGQKTVQIKTDLTFNKSGWLAIRCGHTKSTKENWEKAYTAAHSSPIYVTVNDELPAEEYGAKYMAARSKVSINWCKTQAEFPSEEHRERAVASFEKALKFYEEALARATR